MSYSRHDFHRSTFCIFKEAGIPARNPDYESNSGSQYWFEDNGVYRNSNHWGRAARCKWRLVSGQGKTSRLKCGFAYWSGFACDNEHEKLYFIRLENENAHYFHKDLGEYKGEFLRTSSETRKRLRQIRNYLQKDEPCQAILEHLVNSDKSMHEINRLFSQNPIS